jgi:hypothetical protein
MKTIFNKSNFFKHTTLPNLLIGIFIIAFTALLKYFGIPGIVLSIFTEEFSELHSWVLASFLTLIVKLPAKGFIEELAHYIRDYLTLMKPSTISLTVGNNGNLSNSNNGSISLTVGDNGNSSNSNNGSLPSSQVDNIKENNNPERSIRDRFDAEALHQINDIGYNPNGDNQMGLYYIDGFLYGKYLQQFEGRSHMRLNSETFTDLRMKKFFIDHIRIRHPDLFARLNKETTLNGIPDIRWNKLHYNDTLSRLITNNSELNCFDFIENKRFNEWRKAKLRLKSTKRD